MLSSAQLFSLVSSILCTNRKFSLILLCSALMACGGGGSSTAPDPIINDNEVETPVIEEPETEEPVVEEPAV